jgi:flavin reductase (DIM6/NTAB) family NADH-FMN oxidoreductase RutF
MSVDASVYRAAMSRLATGVTIVTAGRPGGHELMTANAVMSASLEPPLLVVGVSEAAHWRRAVLDHGRFAVNVLGVGHEELALWCADQARHSRPGDVLGCDVAPPSYGLLLRDALATIECRLHAEHEAGDHRLIVGQVERVHVTEPTSEPLVFFARAFTSTAPTIVPLRAAVP